MTETTRSDSLLRGMRPDIAKRLIASFAKRFKQPHLYFAQHAAFPMAFTSDLLYRLWVNFRRDTKGEMLNIPWIAVADMLLSPLCNEVGHELYEMDVTVRTELLNALKANPDFAQRRINELSDFLLDYIQQQLNSNDPDTRDFAQAQRWTALAYVRPGKAAHELVAALRKVDPNDKAELLRLASLIEIFAEPLADFAPLLTYSRGIGYWVRGDQERAVTEFNNMGSREVQGIPLPIPEEARDQVDTQVCPNCGSFMPSWAKFCDKCSSSLPTLQVQAESINTKFVSPLPVSPPPPALLGNKLYHKEGEPMEEPPQPFDICIVCALPEEVRAFLTVVKPHCEGGLEEHTSLRYGYNYRSAALKNDKNELLTLHISWLPRYGPQEMTLHLSHVLEECQPRIVIMTGICAGDVQQVHLGDLVVAERTFTYDNGKFVFDEQGRRVHLHDTLTYQLDANILQFLGLFDDWKPLIAGLETSPPIPDQHKTVCHLKAMASGGAVRADNPFQDVQAPVRGTVAIDMEGAAFGLVMSRHPLTRWLIVKGVCDYADRAKNNAYHDYAACASASYALRFIQAYVTNERLPRQHASKRAKPERTSNPPKPTNIRVISTPSREGNKAVILFVLDETEYTLEYIRYDNSFSDQVIFLKHQQQELVRLAVPFATLKSVEKHAAFQIGGVSGLLTFKMSAVTGIMNIKVEVGGVEVFHN